jgi:hypothetical protein
MMKRYIWIVCAFLCPFIAASVAGAGDFDGTRPLLISIIRVVECTPDAACREVTPASVDLPQFLKIDFANKTIGPAAADDETPATAIERQEVVDGKLILQGAEDGYEKIHDGLGWTIAISDGSGQVVLTASGDQVAFVVFGASLPL